MSKHPILSAGLAGLISAYACMAEPPKPSLQPSDQPQSSQQYSPTEIEALKKKMEDVCQRLMYYQKKLKPFDLGQARKESVTVEFSKAEDTLLSKLPPRGAIPLIFTSISIYTLGRDGCSIRYTRSEGLNEGSIGDVLIRAYDGMQKKCQEMVTGYKTEVKTDNGRSVITNPMTQVNMPNNIESLLRRAERAVLTSRDDYKNQARVILKEAPKPFVPRGYVVQSGDVSVVVFGP